MAGLGANFYSGGDTTFKFVGIHMSYTRYITSKGLIWYRSNVSTRSVPPYLEIPVILPSTGWFQRPSILDLLNGQLVHHFDKLTGWSSMTPEEMMSLPLQYGDMSDSNKTYCLDILKSFKGLVFPEDIYIAYLLEKL